MTDSGGARAEQSSSNSNALFAQAVAEQQQGRALPALALYDQLLLADPAHALALNNRGGVLRDLKRLDEAYDSFNRALAAKPDFVEAHLNRGHLLRDAGHFEPAAADYGRVLALRPDHEPAYLLLGAALRELGRTEDAISIYRQALARRPDFFEAHSNLGNVLNDQGRLDEALAAYDQATALRPTSPDVHKNRGVTLVSMRRFDDALASFDQALALKPDMAEAQWNKALMLLTLGDYERGLPLYETRKRLRNAKGDRAFDAPLWTGAEDLTGKVVFLHAEQGLGDTLLFARYAPMVRARGAHVVLAVQPQLVDLIVTIDPQVRVISDAMAPSAADFHLPLMSLPLAFGTTPHAIPAQARYIAADSVLAARWAERLGPRKRLRIGIAWAGARLAAKAQNRTLPLTALAPVLGLDADLFCLHHEVPAADQPAIRALPRLQSFGAELDFANAAALIEHLDVVVTADTSLAHLAAALGKAVFMLLPIVADWRWMLDRDDTPWYPTMRLFRQMQIGDWSAPVERAAAALKSQFASAAIGMPTVNP